MLQQWRLRKTISLSSGIKKKQKQNTNIFPPKSASFSNYFGAPDKVLHFKRMEVAKLQKKSTDFGETDSHATV